MRRKTTIKKFKLDKIQKKEGHDAIIEEYIQNIKVKINLTQSESRIGKILTNKSCFTIKYFTKKGDCPHDQFFLKLKKN